MSRVFTIIAVLTLPAALHGANADLGHSTDPLTNGSQEHPWRIENLADFQQFCSSAAYWSGFTQLECDLDLSATVYDRAPIAPNLSEEWNYDGTPFSGHFDGQHHTISHLQIQSGRCFAGLFGSVSQAATVTNLHLADVQIRSRGGLGCFGSLCGLNDGQIVHCTVSGMLTDLSYSAQSGRAGGLVAINCPNGIINDCFSAAKVSAGTTAGGLCAVNYGLIDKSSAAGIVADVATTAGGLCAANLGTIRRCFSRAVTRSDYAAGGVCGENSGLITDCYAAGTVIGGAAVGGLCGTNLFGAYAGVINNCYSAAVVSGSHDVGGFCGVNYSKTGSANFWDVQASGTDMGIGRNQDDRFKLSGKTTAQLQSESTVKNAGWDFSEMDGDEADWVMQHEGQDYPRLAWQKVIGDVAGSFSVDLADVAHLATYWQSTDCGAGDCGRADIDGSGTVDLDDLLVILDNWLKGL